MPRMNSMKKNNTANTYGVHLNCIKLNCRNIHETTYSLGSQLTCGKNSNLLIASGYEMKANPAPLLTTLEISSICMLWAKLPRMPNIVMPAIRLVNVSKVVTINTSLLCVDLERVQIEE